MSGMGTGTLQERIAETLRQEIESGERPAGSDLPTLAELSTRWNCSSGPARAAIALLRKQGLVEGGRGRPLTVRAASSRVVRSSTRHHLEKRLALLSEDERRGVGEAEIELGTGIADTVFDARFDTITADEGIARLLGSENVLRRRYEHRRKDGTLLAQSVSYLPLGLIQSNPELLDSSREPWPGGTMHQLRTIGVEIGQIQDLVTARMPTTAEQKAWDLLDGVPLLCCRRLSRSTTDAAVEISDAIYPADRTELHFVTVLSPWS